MARATIRGVSAGAVHVIELTLDQETSPNAFNFAPGQYTSVVHPDGSFIPFSIASSPHRLPELELHFQPVPNAPEAELMMSLLTVGNTLELTPPTGNTFVNDAATPLFFICGGSGVAQAWSILEWLDAQPQFPPTTVLWCVDSAQHLYLEDVLKALPIQLEVHVDSRRDEQNSGMRWLAENALALRQRRIVLCGSPPFVWAAVDALHELDARGWQLASDVFDYAPRTG